MRFGPLVHGILLIAALLFSYQTWTRSKDDAKPDHGAHRIWKTAPGSVTAITFETPTKSARIERRSEGKAEHLWAIVKRTRKVAKKKDPGPARVDGALDAGVPSDAGVSPPVVEEEEIVTTREFPVGEAGAPLLDAFSSLMALRNMGTLDDKRLDDYELSQAENSLTVIFSDKSQRNLIIGSRVYGGKDRYALDPASNTAFIIADVIMKPLESAENSLALKKVHLYKEEAIASIEVKTSKGDKRVLRGEVEDEKGKHTVWSDVEKPDENDQVLANFIGRVAQLKPTAYEPTLKPGDIQHLATLRYSDETHEIGYIEIYRQTPDMQEPSENPKTMLRTQYFVRTERTHSLGKVSRLGAERIDQDLVSIFGIKPPPAAPKKTPAKPKSVPLPAPAKPASTKPASAKPASAKPASAKPASAKPASAKPASAKPASAKPASAKPPSAPTE